MSDPSESQSNFDASMNGLQAALGEAIAAGQAAYNHLGAPISNTSTTLFGLYVGIITDKMASTISPIAPYSQAIGGTVGYFRVRPGAS
jgi:hypothetical protein